MEKTLNGALPHFILQDRSDIFVRVSGVNDDWETGLPGGRNMGAENPCANVTRRLVIMIIEPGFANTDAFRVTRQGYETIQGYFGFFMRVMGMRPNRAKDVFISLSETADRVKGIRSGRNGDHPPNPGGAGAFDHGISLGGEIWEIEVAMTVNEHAGPL
jgi:hypothetical protein